ncbi:hypothetical protein [Aquibacillus rhizosphaerae]|uniref:Uncharacterized protein n=1 Tax=Aquibacillus rhizosphaerae TaxID=3051431 RepID=A0ABT7L1S1_9BACI|nr:hypothetical protein [Aquibacillus sp. LR5S19]MDL4839786.1 hypothetical protein [Aquibacillus sp. LR5S19]
MGLVNKVLTVGAASAAIYGIRKGMQNGTFQRLPETINNALDNPQIQQFMQPIQNMVNNQNQSGVEPTNAVQTIAEQEAKNNNAHFEQW